MIQQESEIRAWLTGQEENMLLLLSDVVNIDSGSRDKAGVDAVGRRFADFFRSHGIEVTSHPLTEVGDVLRAATPAGRTEDRPFVLLGHRDTVFPAGEATRRPFRREGSRAYGPGVADMKSGLVMNAFVLAAFKTIAPQVPVVALMTGDEEIGSRTSRPVIETEVKAARAVFNAEPGRANGNIVNGRKGGLVFRFDVQGKAAHSGANFTAGASAIKSAAHKILALHALSRIEEGITVNVGLIGGGQSVNTVAPHAWGEIDVRYVSPGQREALVGEIDAIMARSEVDGTSASAALKSEFLPLARSPAGDALGAFYLAVARDLGHGIDAEFTGGCADSGFTASMGVPTICGLGAVGGMYHTVDEYIEVRTVAERACILATAIARLASQPRTTLRRS